MILWHPLYARSCKLCIEYAYSADGSLPRDHLGNPRQRPQGIPTPCFSCPKVPVEIRELDYTDVQMRQHADELTPWNRQAYDFYKRCKAVGQFPDDPLVRWYAGILREVEDAHERYLAEKNSVAIGSLITLIGKYRG